jgi:hypothetical protein
VKENVAGHPLQELWIQKRPVYECGVTKERRFAKSKMLLNEL